MKVGDFLLEGNQYKLFLEHIVTNYVYTTPNLLNSDGMIKTLITDKVGVLFERYRHNYFYDYVIDLKQADNDNIMIKYIDTYGKTLKNSAVNFVAEYAYILKEYDTLKQKLTTNHSKKCLVSENVTTNELTGSNENVATTSNTLNTEKINQGTPIDTNIYGVGNTLSAEKGKNTNNENTTTTQNNSENATNTTVSSFNVNYLLTLDNYNALIELDMRLKDITTDMVNKFFYNPFKEIFINAIDFERIERIRGV